MTNHYELLYLVPANYTEEELVPIKEKVKELIKKFKGEVTFEDTIGKKKLAYPVAKNTQGYYLLFSCFHFFLSPGVFFRQKTPLHGNMRGVLVYVDFLRKD
jgi:ribosomal protein S6